MRVLPLLCLLRICLGALIEIAPMDWLSRAVDCIREGAEAAAAAKGRVVLVVDELANDYAKLANSVTGRILGSTSGIVLEAVRLDRTRLKRRIGSYRERVRRVSLPSRSFVVYLGSSRDARAKLKDLVRPSDSQDLSILPTILVLALDSKSLTRFDYALDVTDGAFEAAACGSSLQARSMRYIEFEKGRLEGPEGKIAQTLVESVNATAVSTGRSSSVKLELVIAAIGQADGDDETGLRLNPLKPRPLGMKRPGEPTRDKLNGCSLVYRPYRSLPLVPAPSDNWTGMNHLEYGLLLAVSIMIILLLHIIRRLMSMCENQDRSVVLGGLEKLLFVSLVLALFVNLAIILEMLFRGKYGADRRLVIASLGDLERMNLAPAAAPQSECLRRMIVDGDRDVFCVVEEDFGRELVARYGGDRPLLLVDSVNVGFEWRAVFFAEAGYTEGFDRMQLRFLESGLLDKWYRSEMTSRREQWAETIGEARPDRLVADAERQRVRSANFVGHLALVIVAGCFMALLMFVGELYVVYLAGRAMDSEIGVGASYYIT